MNACSNHPSTIRGAELKKLVAASEKLHGLLKEHLNIAACLHGIDYQSYQLLYRLRHDDGHTEERGLGLLRSAGLVTGETPNVMVTTEGIKACAQINNARDDWLDNASSLLDVEDLRAATSLLGRIRV